MMKKETLLRAIPLLSGGIALCVYCYTLAPSIAHIDSGELAAVQATCGIAHPTGYPLFTILGYFFTSLPIGLPKILLSNLLAALFCAIGVTIFSSLMVMLFQSRSRIISRRDSIETKTKDSGSNAIIFSTIVLTGSFVFGFSKTYWLQSVSVEVYSLSICLVLWAFYQVGRIAMRYPQSVPIREWLLLGFIFGLGFGNHLMVIFAIPASALVWWKVERNWNRRITTLTSSALMAIGVAALLYAFLLIRSNQKPLLDWGAPSTLRSLWLHITAAQYAGGLFSSKEVFFYNMANFLKSIPYEFAHGWFVFLIPGALWMWRHAKTPLLVISATFICVALIATNYNIRDIYTYYLPAYACVATLIVVGIYATFNWARNDVFRMSISIVYAILAFGYQVWLNSGVSHRGLYTYEDYAKGVMSSVEKGAVVVGSRYGDWDVLTSPMTYLQYVEGIRTDVIALDGGLLAMPWYYAQLDRLHPGSFDQLQLVVKNLGVHRERYYSTMDEDDLARYSLAYKAAAESTISVLGQHRTVYLTPRFLMEEVSKRGLVLPPSTYPIPDLLLFRLVRDTSNYFSLRHQNISVRFPRILNSYTDYVRSSILGVMAARANIYEVRFGRLEERDSLRRSLDIIMERK